MLLTLLLIPMLTAAVLVWNQDESRAGTIALTGSLIAFAWSLVVLAGFDFSQSAMYQHETSIEWIPALGLTLRLGMDSVSLLLVLLTTFLMPLAILGSFTAVTERARLFFFWLLVLETAMIGVFVALDLIIFYVCFEFTLLPMFFLIAIYGSTNRARASIVFFLYTFTGSMVTLAGLIYVAWFHWSVEGTWTFDITRLVSAAGMMTPTQQGWVLLALLCGFAVKVPLFPVHTWLPLAHTEAPTAGSVILAAVLLKLGTYGLYRFALPMCPVAITQYAPIIAILCIIGIIYGALICWVQRDIKKLVAYSSVSHLGFCVLGLVALNSIGVSGAIAYMINHGLSTGALFLCIGMVYERFHTRSMDHLGGLARRMPVWTFFVVFFTMSSVALPGLNGFIGEFLALVGTFISGQTVDGVLQPGTLGPWYAAWAGVGMILAAIYLLYLAGYVIFGPVRLPPVNENDPHHHGPKLPRDLSFREITVLTPIAIACLVLGFKPGVILDPIKDPVDMVTAYVHDQANDVGLAKLDDEGSVTP